MTTTEEAVKDAPKSKSRSSAVAVWLGILLSIGAVALLLSRVSFADLATSVKSADAKWFGPALVIFFIMFAFRALRWAVLLGGTRFWPTWHANTIGYFFNMTLPLRLGEIARAYVISKNENVTMARALSAVLVERLLDLASVVLLFAYFAQKIPMRPAFTRAATVGSVAIIVCVFFGVLVVVKGEAFERIAAPRLARLGQKRADALLGKSKQIREGLAAVGSGKRIAQAVGLTAIIWALTLVLSDVYMLAFFPDADMTKAGLTVVVANLGGALPSAPGGLGMVQGFATSALVVPFNVPESAALAFVLVWSLSQQLLLILLGFVSIGRVGLSFREIRAGAQKAPD